MTTQIQLRRGTAAQWTATNPILAQGELAAELDTGKFKIGNGTAAWTALAYSSGIQGVGVSSIARTSGTGAAGTTDTYTITFSNATTSTFTLTNGTNGVNGVNGEVTLATAQTLTNKTISAASNTITTAASGNLAATSLNAALAELQGDIDTRAPSSTTVTLTGAQTLTSKTLTGYTETVYNLAGTDIAEANGSIQTKTLAANTAFTESLTDGQSVILGITAGAYSITWPSIVWVKVGGSGVAPTLTSTGVNWVILWQVGGVVRGSFMGTA